MKLTLCVESHRNICTVPSALPSTNADVEKLLLKGVHTAEETGPWKRRANI